MTTFYRMILRLYPADYRKAFAGQMMQTFGQARDDAGKRGFLHLLRFAVREAAGLIKGLILRRLEAKPLSVYLPAYYGTSEAAALERQIEKMIRCMEFAIANHDFPKARFYSYAERAARQRLQQLTGD